MMAKQSIGQLLCALRAVENAVLVLLLLAMLLLAVTQIIMRNFFDAGLIWGDNLLRVLVLWVGLIGAMLASRKAEHINIDLLTRIIAPAHSRWLGVTSALATSAITALLAWHSARFVLLEYEDGLIAFAGVPNWLCASIMPFAFAIIALRYLSLALIKLSRKDTAMGEPAP